MALAGWREPITCAVAAGVAAALAACVLGPLVLRKRGMPLIMITFVLALIFHEAANKASDWTGGDNGLTGFTFAPLFGRFGWSVYSRAEYLYVLGWLFLLLFACKRIVASPFGLALQGVRENAARMPLLGASVRGHLLRVYAVSAFMAGVAGALLTQTTKFVGLSALSVDVSIDALVMLTLGGVGALYGAIVGAGVYVAIHHFASEWNPYHWMFVIGFLLLAVVMFGRGGLLGLGRSALRFVNARAKGGRP
jgi:branched-chain amino acid transport system permease protein